MERDEILILCHSNSEVIVSYIEDLESRYSDLESRYNAEVADLESRYSDLESRYNELESQNIELREQINELESRSNQIDKTVISLLLLVFLAIKKLNRVVHENQVENALVVRKGIKGLH